MMSYRFYQKLSTLTVGCYRKLAVTESHVTHGIQLSLENGPATDSTLAFDYSTYHAGLMVGSEMYSEDVDVPRAISLDYFNENFVRRSSGYNGYSSFEELPDHFTIPSGGSEEERADVPPSLLPEHNTQESWIAWLVDEPGFCIAKGGRAGPGGEESGFGVGLGAKADFVGPVAQRAEAFVGNGFSSLTLNIIMFRIAIRRLAQTTRPFAPEFGLHLYAKYKQKQRMWQDLITPFNLQYWQS
ncbi:hypothetical protein AX14_003007 [Amanita brunnescens Koide BX004]|nr:hypothetical protein AX14_003007 [Amanita brunnescens Koide BX004]